jgi:tetratricopeptide (TPR) repeat protein
LFFFLTLYCSIRALPARTNRWRLAALLACGAGMMCKETMVAAPIVVILYDRLFVHASFAQAFERRWRLYAGFAASWLLLALLVATSGRTTAGFDSGVAVTTYLLNQAPIIVDYLTLVVWPRGLVLDYGIPAPYTVTEVALPALIVLALLVSTVIALRWRPRLGFLLAVVFITLAPTSSILPIATEVGALRRMYLPLAALIVLAVCGACRLAAARRLPNAVLAPALAALCAVLVAVTVVRNGEFDSYLSLAQLDVARRPHGRAHLAFGTQLLRAGRRPEALAQFHLAKTANATGASFALGTEYLVDGDLDNGVRELSRFIRRNGDHVNAIGAREMIMRAYMIQRKPDDALREATELLKIDPANLKANEVRGQILLDRDLAAEALPHLQVVAAARGNDADAQGRLGAALAMRGRFAEAVRSFDRVLTLAPGHAAALRMRERARRELSSR